MHILTSIMILIIMIDGVLLFQRSYISHIKGKYWMIATMISLDDNYSYLLPGITSYLSAGEKMLKIRVHG